MTPLTTLLMNLSHIPLLIGQLMAVMYLADYLNLREALAAAVGGDSNRSVVFLALLSHVIGFWVIGGLLASLPYLGAPGKLQPDRSTNPLEGMQLICLNCLIGLVVSISCSCAFLPPMDSPLPDFATTLRDVLVFIVIEEFLFFHFHMLGHLVPFLYISVHKVHHRFSSPLAYHVVYTHPIEHVMVNLLPLILGPVLMRSHVLLAILWMSVGQLTSLVAHCGYSIPIIPTNPLHDLHHKNFTGNFGVLGFFDYIYGTLK